MQNVARRNSLSGIFIWCWHEGEIARGLIFCRNSLDRGRAMWSHLLQKQCGLIFSRNSQMWSCNVVSYAVLCGLAATFHTGTLLISLKWKSTTTTATVSSTFYQPKAATFVCKWCHCLSLTLRAIFLITNLLILKIFFGVYVLIFTFDDPANIL